MPARRGLDDVQPARCRQEVAAILARGALRHCRMARSAASLAPEEPPGNPQNCLEVVNASRLPVTPDSGGCKPREPGKGAET